MKVRIALLIEKITSHFWIIPVVITVFLICLFFFLRQFTISSNNPYLQELFFLNAKPAAIRLLLSSIATSIMTVLGVVFSIIVVVIEQMSNQYTPRVVSNFTRSKMAQIVLGTYVGTFSYCLLLLMNIGENDGATPRLAIAVAGLLAILCVMLLVLFIHDITRSIQSTEIIKSIAAESIEALRNVIKDRESAHVDSNIRAQGFKHCTILHSSKTGYVDSLYWEKFKNKLKNKSWEIHFHKNPGDFIQKEMELLTIWTDEPISSHFLQDLEEVYEIASSRTISQDPGYGIQKLSDIALKALSPGINDPSTAIEAIHSITAVLLEYICSIPIRNRVHIDENKFLIFNTIEPEKLLQYGYDSILRFCENHEVVKDLIRQDLRFIQGRVQKHELRKHLEWKIQSITLLQ